MKSLEIYEKSQKNQGGILKKLLIPQGLIALEYQPCYQSNARIKYSHRVVKYKKNLICIFINLNENIRTK